MIDLRQWVEQLAEIRTMLETAGRGCLLVVTTTDPALERGLAGILREALDGRAGEYIFDRYYPSLSAWMETLPPDGPRVVLVHGLDDLPTDARARALRHLNREREALARAGRSVVLFVRPETVQDLIFQAGDFWAWRAGLYTFEAPPDEAARQEALAALRLSLPASLEALRRRYLEYIVAAYRWLDLRGLMQVRNLVRLPLSQVYVPLLGRKEEVTIALLPIHIRVGMPGVPEPVITVSSSALSQFRRDIVIRELPLDQALREHRYLVVLGDPGSGKSTFLRYVALACAEGPQAAQERLGLPEAPLPILVPLAAYVLAWRKEQGRPSPDFLPRPSLEEFLPRYFQGLGLPDLGPLFAHVLKEGRAILLLDGLDEVTSAEERRAVVLAVEALAAAYPRCRFVVTSRIAGYDAAPLSGPFVRFTLAPLDREGIRRFAHNWSLAYEAAGSEEVSPELSQRARARAEDLFQAVTSHPSIERLAANPLLLTILALIHYQGTRLPQQRVELYRLCVEALAETWNLARSLSGRPIDLWLGERRLDERTVVGILAPVAFWMHQERPGGLVEREELVRQVARGMEQAAWSRGAGEQRSRGAEGAERLARDFVELAREQMGLLVERGQGQFGFVHLTFQEYLAARFAAAQEEPFALLRPYLHAPRWREVVLLTAGILGDFSRAHATRFVCAIYRARSPYESLLYRDLRLALRILADDVPVEGTLAEEIVGRAARILRSTRYGKLRDELASRLAALRGGEYEALAVSHLTLALQDENAPVRGAAAWALGALGCASDEVVAALLDCLRDEDGSVRGAAAWALGALGCASDEVVAALLDRLRDEDAWVRWAAAGALGELGRASNEVFSPLAHQDEVVSALRDCLQDENAWVWRAAAKALEVLGHPSNVGWGLVAYDDAFVATLLNRLQDNSGWERRLAAEELGASGYASDEIVMALTGRLQDEDAGVRQAAARALGRLGHASDEVVAALVNCLQDEDAGVRRAAAEALGALGRASDEVVGALVDRLGDRDALVRQAAAEALGRVGHPSPFLLRRLLCLLGHRWYLPWNLPCLPRALWARVRGYDQVAFVALWNLMETEHTTQNP